MISLTLDKHCCLCPDLAISRNNIVFGYGDTQAEILILGLAPGRLGADITGVPFTKDRSGIVIQKALIKSCLSNETDPQNHFPKLKNVFITNIVKCNPKTIKNTNRNPSIEEISNCSSHLKIELASIKPKAIFLLGKLVAETFLNKSISKFTEYNMQIIKKDTFTCIPFYHPSYCARGMISEEDYIKMFIKSLLELKKAKVIRI